MTFITPNHTHPTDVIIPCSYASPEQSSENTSDNSTLHRADALVSTDVCMNFTTIFVTDYRWTSQEKYRYCCINFILFSTISPSTTGK